jgi:hypothetical protein
MVTASICRIVSKYLYMWVSPTLFERGETNREVAVVTLSSNGLGDIPVCPSLLWATNKRVKYETI